MRSTATGVRREPGIIKNFKDKMYSIYVSACEIDNSDYDKMCKEGLITTKAILIGYLQEMRGF